MSVAKYFYFVTSHLRFLGKPSVWGSRPWSSPTPSPSSFSSAPPLPSSSTVSWLLGGVLFPYQPPWRPAPRLRWEVLWRPSWWPDDCLCSLSTLSPRATGKKKLPFISSQSLSTWASSPFCPSVSSRVGSSQILQFFSRGKKALLLISQWKITPTTSDPTILEQIEEQWCHHFTAGGPRFNPIIWDHNCFAVFWACTKWLEISVISESQADAIERNLSLRGKILGNWQLFDPIAYFPWKDEGFVWEEHSCDHFMETPHLPIVQTFGRSEKPQTWLLIPKYRVEKFPSRFTAWVCEHRLFCKFCWCGQDFFKTPLLKPTWKYENNKKNNNSNFLLMNLFHFHWAFSHHAMLVLMLLFLMSKAV